MSIEKSILTQKDIIELLKTKYNIEGNAEIKKIDRGSSNLYEIDINNKRYILEEFNSNKSTSLVEKEICIIEYLKGRKISVPQYIQTNAGRYYFIFNKKVIILQQFIDGYAIKNEKYF